MRTVTKVKKPVEAIQCANTFSLLQRKMYNVLLANAAGRLLSDATHRISMRSLCDLMGYHSNDYKTIKQKFRELRRMDIEWDVINEEGNKVWTNTSPLSLARVIEGEGVCEYEFTPSLVPFLDRPAQYAKFSLIIQAKFKSSYGLALYENCERYRNVGKTKAFDVQTFRKLMGVGEAEYLEFFALKRRVINSAIKEVNLYADFDIEPEYGKVGRSVTSIRFLISNKEKQQMLPAVPESLEKPRDDGLEENLKKYFGLKKNEIQKVITEYGKNYVEEKANNIIDSPSFKNGSIQNMAGYLKKALTEDYQSNISSKTIVDILRKRKEAELELQKEQEKQIKELEASYANYMALETCSLIKMLSDEEKRKIFDEFEKSIGTGAFLRAYQKEGINNVLVAERFVEFIKFKHTDLLNEICTFKEYITEHKK